MYARTEKTLKWDKPKGKDPSFIEEGREVLKRAASRSPRLTDPDPDELLTEMQDLISEKDW